ncbi:uncharacterized protein LOC123298498 isoform X2 [Chrysoperla carnea]|uniref:uncharacterized protein LOC123298498 isoform X2 n=1 Tax=Chrysoperla carnea TaxID=189513 RepID=UPI001D088F70|nr:uncharacterized protein LOC123298498 isoform X2 [Chrysoperla carnea]
MASTADTSLKSVTRPFPRSERRLQKKLRSTGQEYVSRTGKIVPAKKVPDVLCTCPQKCDERVSRDAREQLFNYFYGLADFEKQNAFLRLHLTVRSRPPDDDPFRQHRRITCKYLLPILPENNKIDVCQKAFVNAFVITEKRVRRVREKMFAQLGLTTYHHTEKQNQQQQQQQLQLQQLQQLQLLQQQSKINVIHFPLNGKPPDGIPDEPESCDSPELPDPRDNPLVPWGIVLPEGVTIAPVTQTADHVRDIAIVNNFFSNQLWKPEYITS